MYELAKRSEVDQIALKIETWSGCRRVVCLLEEKEGGYERRLATIVRPDHDS